MRIAAGALPDGTNNGKLVAPVAAKATPLLSVRRKKGLATTRFTFVSNGMTMEYERMREFSDTNDAVVNIPASFRIPNNR